MRERQMLECIQDIADMEYHETGDKWWLKIAIEAAKKEKGGKNAFWL